jgi:hypothetical protein
MLGTSYSAIGDPARGEWPSPRPEAHRRLGLVADVLIDFIDHMGTEPRVAS